MVSEIVDNLLFGSEKMLIKCYVQRTPQISGDGAVCIDDLPKLPNDVFYPCHKSERFYRSWGRHCSSFDALRAHKIENLSFGRGLLIVSAGCFTLVFAI